jgi:hypothetical protein
LNFILSRYKDISILYTYFNMSNNFEEKNESGLGVVPLQELFDNLKSGSWKYVIDHENVRELKGSIQMKARIIDTKTNMSISPDNVTVKASAVTIKNGPYTEKGQRIPKDVLRSVECNEKTFKTCVDFGSKSSGLLGEFTEWFSDNIWKPACQDVAERFGITKDEIVVPFPICKTMYGSKKNPGDPTKKKAYMDKADWKFSVKIRGNTKSKACFGFTLFGYETSGTGARKVEVPVTANNMSTWFRGGNRGIMLYEISDVTLNTVGTVNTFYHGRTPVEFHLKRESRKKEYKNIVSSDEMADLCGIIDGEENGEDIRNENDPEDPEEVANSSEPLTAEGIAEQLAKMAH